MKPTTTAGFMIGFGTALVATNAYFTHVISDTVGAVREVQGEVKQLRKEVKEVREVVTYVSKAQLQLSKQEEDCLAHNIFYEAGIEPHVGKLAVAQVTINRLKSGQWGSDVCKVVHAKAQFSWTLDKRKRLSKPKGPLWTASLKAVRDVKQGVRIKNLERSQFYHANYISKPSWAQSKVQVHKIGQHIFYL